MSERPQAGKGDKHASRINPRAYFNAPFWDRPDAGKTGAAPTMASEKILPTPVKPEQGESTTPNGQASQTIDIQ